MPDITMAEAGGAQDFPSKLTSQVVICSIIAACGGLMFGYDIGISGGVTSMDMFLKKFFMTVYIRKHQSKSDNYCKYSNEKLQLFTSSLYLAGIVASFIASFLCKKLGRRPTMQLASMFFVAGAILNAAAENLPMLIVGRLCLGVGVGFGNQTVPLFISEIAPAKYRGGLNLCFQLLITIGILIANIINYFTSKLQPYGWRISLGGAAGPALILLIGSLIIVETPTSLIERGKKEKGLKTLKKIRGVDNVQKEYEEILKAVEFSKLIKHPFRNLFGRSNRPQLLCGTIIQIFQQFTGISIITFYAPVLFQTMGLGDNASLLSAVFTNTLKPIATILAIFIVDRLGRKVLLIEGAIQMMIAMVTFLNLAVIPYQKFRFRLLTSMISQAVIGAVFAGHLHSTNIMSKHYAIIVIIMLCLFLPAFAWSWGPLGWLIPSEIYPLETRSAGFFVAVSANMVFTFLVAQTFLTMLCHLRSSTFYVFAALLAIMALFSIFLLPETKGVPLDEMVERVWRKHWFWKKYYTAVSD